MVLLNSLVKAFMSVPFVVSGSAHLVALPVVSIRIQSDLADILTGRLPLRGTDHIDQVYGKYGIRTAESGSKYRNSSSGYFKIYCSKF